MTAVAHIDRRPRLTAEDHQDRWNEAAREFLRAPDGEGKERLLERFAAFYRSLCSGSSVGLDLELEVMEKRANAVIEAERAKRGEA